MLRLSLVALAACATPAPVLPTQAPPSLRPTLDAHLHAIEQRSIDALLATVDDRELRVILPNGKTIDTRAAYEAFHREWFAETDWTMRFTVEHVEETPALAYALTSYVYTDPSGSRSRWLLLVFRHRDGGWKLIHDQNTPRE